MRVILLLIVFLISYGSLYPFQFAFPDDTHRLLWGTWDVASRQTSRTDIVGNVLLFIPYGLVAALAARGESGRHMPLRLVAAIVGGVALAVVLQWAQQFLPARVPAMYDAVLNVAGIALGLVAGMLLGSRRVRGWLPSSLSGYQLPASLFIALCWIILRLFPFVPSLDLSVIKDSLKPLILQPELHYFSSFRNTFGWVVFYLLLSLNGFRRLPVYFLLIGPLTLAAEVLVVDNKVTLSNFIGMVAGTLVYAAIHPRRLTRFVVPVLFVFVLVNGLYPFELSSHPNDFSWIPFSGLLTGSLWVNTEVLFEKIFYYGAMVVMLHAIGARLGAASTASALWILMVEGGQIFFHGHSPEITDPLIPVFLAFVVHYFDKLRWFGRRRARPGARRINAR